MKRSALKKGSKPLQRKARLKARGKSRFPKRRDPQYAAWIRSQRCILSWCYGLRAYLHLCHGRVEGCHVRSRGAGGDDRANMVPLCHAMHEQQHQIGIRSFQARWGLDLSAEAARLYQAYLAEGGRA